MVAQFSPPPEWSPSSAVVAPSAAHRTGGRKVSVGHLGLYWNPLSFQQVPAPTMALPSKWVGSVLNFPTPPQVCPTGTLCRKVFVEHAVICIEFSLGLLRVPSAGVKSL